MRLTEIQHLSDNFYKWFGNSKVTAPDGKPLIMYHGTSSDFETFHSDAHFGSARAANDRISSKRHIFGSSGIGDNIRPVYLKIVNPLEVSDNEASDEATLLGSIIKGKYPQLDLDVARKYGAIEAAKRAGYDGFKYRNQMEDAGSISWVIFHSKQVRSAFCC